MGAVPVENRRKRSRDQTIKRSCQIARGRQDRAIIRIQAKTITEFGIFAAKAPSHLRAVRAFCEGGSYRVLNHHLPQEPDRPRRKALLYHIHLRIWLYRVCCIMPAGTRHFRHYPRPNPMRRERHPKGHTRVADEVEEGRVSSSPEGSSNGTSHKETPDSSNEWARNHSDRKNRRLARSVPRSTFFRYASEMAPVSGGPLWEDLSP